MFLRSCRASLGGDLVSCWKNTDTIAIDAQPDTCAFQAVPLQQPLVVGLVLLLVLLLVPGSFPVVTLSSSSAGGAISDTPCSLAPSIATIPYFSLTPTIHDSPTATPIALSENLGYRNLCSAAFWGNRAAYVDLHELLCNLVMFQGLWK
jgi:hypothetical protein